MIELTDGYEQLLKSSTRNDLKKLRRLILKLAVSVNKLPSSFMLQDVQCPQPVSRGAGSFADVYCGTLGTAAVAIKRLRTHSATLAATEVEKIKLEQVCSSSSSLNNGRDVYLSFRRTFVASQSFGRTSQIHTFCNSSAYLRMHSLGRSA